MDKKEDRAIRNIFLVLMLITVAFSIVGRASTAHAESACEIPSNAKVTKAYHVKPDGTQKSEIAPEDIITVEVENLYPFLKEPKCSQNIVLYLEDRPLKSAFPYPPTSPDEHPTGDANKRILRFPLKLDKLDKDSKALWTYLLAKPGRFLRKTKVSIGIQDQYAIRSEATIDLKVIPAARFWGWFCFFMVVLIGFLYMVARTNVLRDSISQAEGERGFYSLARTQAAWWFFLFLLSYVFIGLVARDYNVPIPGTVLGLLGISAGIVVGSAFVDAFKPSLASDIQVLQREIQTSKDDIKKLDDEAQTLSQNPGDAAAQQKLVNKQKELLEKQAELIKKKEVLASRQSQKGTKSPQLNQLKKNWVLEWLLDILSDANGISFHRFQMFVLTIVLGVIFITSVFRTLEMPNFDGSLAVLLAVSAGTYLGLKIPEPTTQKK